MSLDLIGILSLLVSFQLFLIAIFLLSLKKGRRLSNRLLGLFFLFLGINITDVLLQLNEVTSIAPLFFFIDDAFLLLFGPLLYLYTRSIVFQSYKLSLREALHFVPFLLAFFGLFMIYIGAPASFENGLETVETQQFSKVIMAVLIVFYLHGACYLWLSKKLMRSYRYHIRSNYSNLSKIDLNWLNFILNSFFIIWLLGFLQALIPFSAGRSVVLITLLGLILYLFYFINRVLFKALRRPELFTTIPFSASDKYSGSTLSEKERNQIAESLLVVMEKDELYLEPDLSVQDLARNLNVSTKALSQTINQSFNQHFFDFVNTYRIEAAKRLLLNPTENLTVQEIMYAVGFSSKSSFNTIFRRQTGLTPSQFRNQSR